MERFFDLFAEYFVLQHSKTCEGKALDNLQANLMCLRCTRISRKGGCVVTTMGVRRYWERRVQSREFVRDISEIS